MRRLMPLLAAAALLLSTATAQADLGDQLFKLLPKDGAANDEFGYSVAISGTTAIVGAHADDDNGGGGLGSGSAYLFDTTTGQQVAKLLANDAWGHDWFGTSVAISGTTAIIGAFGDDDNGTSSGSAYLFDTTTGRQIAKLMPNDGAWNDEFGHSVAISGTTAIVGAWHDGDNGYTSGSAYLFDTTTGQQISKLLANDGAADDYFGGAVAISGTTAIVGAEGDGDNGDSSGSAYLYDTITGQQIAKLLANDGAEGDWFGRSVAISDTTAIVGALYNDHNGSNSGSVYLFDTATGRQIAQLAPDDSAAHEYFGLSVAISGNTAIIGAWHDDGSNPGSAYLFDTTSTQQIAKLLPDDPAEGDNFGWSVAINGTTAVIGAIGGDDNSYNSGSAYLFDAAACLWDFDGDGTVGASDLAELLGTWGPNPGHPADLDGDGEVGPADLAILLKNWGPCP